MNQINNLNEKYIKIERKGKKLMIKINFYGQLLDGLARYLCLNQNGQSGYYCCHYCLIRGRDFFKLYKV